MINTETINNISIEDYCKQHCESCIHNCVCDNKNKEGLITYFEGLKVSKNNSALFDNVEFVCPYHKEEEIQLEIKSNEFLKSYQKAVIEQYKQQIATLTKENKELKIKNKELKSSNKVLSQEVKSLESIRNSLNYLLKCETIKNEVLSSLIKYLKNEVKKNG